MDAYYLNLGILLEYEHFCSAILMMKIIDYKQPTGIKKSQLPCIYFCLHLEESGQQLSEMV